MKGPGLRLTLAVERRWTCPACGRKVTTDGDVTTLSCACTDPPQWMKMADPKTNPRPVPRMPDAQTLTDEDLDRLGIEALKEPVAELTAVDMPPEVTKENLGDSEELNSPSSGELNAQPECENGTRNDASAEPPSKVSTEPRIPTESDDFGAGLDEDV